MVTVQEAISIIESNTVKLQTQQVDLIDALGCTLAQEIKSTIDMPPFNQSAMDGYAVALHDSSIYTLIGEIKAGDNAQIELQPGECVRIFTGAMVPEGANCVAKQEIVERIDDTKIRVETPIFKFGNIRPKGEQISKGDLGLAQGTFINTGAIGFAAMLGRTSLTVYQKPQIAVIATGSELIKPGLELPDGAIYESNTFSLQAALKTAGFSASIDSVEDDYDATKAKIKDAIDRYDVVMITGGISVGDYDFVGDILSELGVNTGFYKIKQKPGKPMYFGYKGSKLIFALPGNPASALSCYYNYVLPALNMMAGKAHPHLEKRTLTLQSDYKKTPKMTHFLKGLAQDDKVEILGKQSSAMLNSFVDGNCLIILEEGLENWNSGDKVQALMIPQ